MAYPETRIVNLPVDIKYKTIKQLIATLKDVGEKHGFDKELELDYDYDYGLDASISYERPETEAEKESRLRLTETSRLYRLRQYETLKKEFEPQS